MPPSGRKGKTRVKKAPATEVHEPSDAETPEAIATPSRASRKRARASDTIDSASRVTRRKTKDTRPSDREGTEGTEPQRASDDETEPAAPSEADIISHLYRSSVRVNASEDFANDLLAGQEHVPGYGKIAGRDWTFIIRKVEVNIGRPETQERLVADENGHTGGVSSRTVVDIDLGPDRQVSRSHAVISYDSDSMGWFIVVNGRNGLRMDNNLLKRGTKSFLRNGSVIDIQGTQMAFITTAAEGSDGPVWDASIIKQTQKSSEEDEGDDDSRHPNGLYPRANAQSYLQNPNSYASEVGNSRHQHHKEQQNRTHPHAPRDALQTTPGTPMRQQPSFNKSSPAANYARGVMMESTETIDYSADTAKDLKPPHSYAQLIGMAILSTAEQQMTLSNIYKFITDHYAFYRFNTGGWQNSIRHNLSLNKAFTKIARRTDEPGKGMKWMIEPTEYDNFVQQGMKGCKRPNAVPGTQSSFGSPTSPMYASKAGMKREEDMTPPSRSYQPSFQSGVEAYTPDRAPKRQADDSTGLGINGDGQEYEFSHRLTPRNGLSAIANASGSPPALYVSDESRVGPLDTPFPLRPSQRFAPPSTLKRPSDFIQFSSPAPFWKMEGLVGSTPFKPYDLSPLKTPFPDLTKTEADIKDVPEVPDDIDKTETINETSTTKPNRCESPVINSSSPPRPVSSDDAIERSSPTLSRPATAVAKTLSQLAGAGKDVSAKGPAASSEASEASAMVPNSSFARTHQSPALSQPTPPIGSNLAQVSSAIYTAPPGHIAPYGRSNSSTNGFHDDGEDEGIDLAKGFQPIGAFHQRNHIAMMAPAAQASAYGR